MADSCCENCGWSEIVGSPIMCNFTGHRTFRDEICQAWKPKEKEQQPKKGHWIDIDSQMYTWKVRCDQCGHERSMMSTQGEYPRFCEGCGADMRGEQE